MRCDSRKKRTTKGIPRLAIDYSSSFLSLFAFSWYFSLRFLPWFANRSVPLLCKLTSFKGSFSCASIDPTDRVVEGSRLNLSNISHFVSFRAHFRVSFSGHEMCTGQVMLQRLEHAIMGICAMSGLHAREVPRHRYGTESFSRHMVGHCHEAGSLYDQSLISEWPLFF